MKIFMRSLGWMLLTCTLAIIGFKGCSTPDTTETAAENNTSPETGTTQDASQNTPDQTTPETPANPEGSAPENSAPQNHPSCAKAWDQISRVYQGINASSLKSCDGVAGAKAITDTLFNLNGITINNNGKKESPCIEAKCDGSFVYVVTNAIPHYDFIQTTPNALKENLYVYKLPFTTTEIKSDVKADVVKDIKGCEQAYKQYLTNPRRGTQTEPGGYCTVGPRVPSNNYLIQDINGKKTYYHKLACFGAVGFVLSGVPVFGPNEAAIPDPYGNPFVYIPDLAKEYKVPTDLKGAALMDLCFAHTAFTMHHHGINQACFERKADRSPKSSYPVAVSTWDWKASLTADCKQESPIIGWALDGVPIKGPCVCIAKNADGSCKTLKKARSSWVMQGLKSWGDDPNEKTALGIEGTNCSADDDCCKGVRGKCRFRCKYSVVDDKAAPGGTSVGKKCTLLDYSWCTNRHIPREGQDVSKVNFVYMDRCNGYKGANGYAYHTTSSFPLIVGCFSKQPTDALQNSGRLVQRGGGPPRP